MTQRELADRCKEAGVKVSDSQLSKIERGVCMPYPPLRAVLAKLLDLDIDLQQVQDKTEVKA
jgi:transcriptional regulator with XRE-family HTH domain